MGFLPVTFLFALHVFILEFIQIPKPVFLAQTSFSDAKAHHRPP